MVQKIISNGGHLDTGFVGTPYLCRALTKAGQNAAACALLLKEDYPSWLYQVKHGATTVWESWKALDDQGHLTGKDSLNHYTFGSVVEWLYADAAGLNNFCGTAMETSRLETAVGFKALHLTPHPDKRLGYMKAFVNTQSGKINIQWDFKDNGKNQVDYRIEF